MLWQFNRIPRILTTINFIIRFDSIIFDKFPGFFNHHSLQYCTYQLYYEIIFSYNVSAFRPSAHLLALKKIDWSYRSSNKLHSCWVQPKVFIFQSQFPFKQINSFCCRVLLINCFLRNVISIISNVTKNYFNLQDQSNKTF